MRSTFKIIEDRDTHGQIVHFRTLANVRDKKDLNDVEKDVWGYSFF